MAVRSETKQNSCERTLCYRVLANGCNSDPANTDSETRSADSDPVICFPVRNRIGRNLLGGWTALVLLFLYIPIVLLVAYSFNASRLNIRWGGFTTAWYAQLFSERDLMRAVMNSLIIAVATTIVAVPMGVLAAWGLYRYRLRFGRAIDLLAMIPIAMPEILIGVSLLSLFALVSRATDGAFSPGYT